ncbi:hypothetical protein KWE21_04060 [Acinetobacter pittii]|uniref:hypothetical protein n=1 Tax=Acinetobacter pittii TaxID=48296 RepID=UPI00355B58DA
MIQVEGTLPVPLKKLVGQTEIKSQKIVMRQLTAIEYLSAKAAMLEGQFIGIADLAVMTKLIGQDGKEYEITYDMLGHSSSSNLYYLEEKRKELDAKEIAENLEVESE